MELSPLLRFKKKLFPKKGEPVPRGVYIAIAFFIGVLLLPNIVLAVQFYPPAQGLILLSIALAVLLVPALFLPVRLWLFLEGLFLLLLPLDLASWLSMHQPISEGFMLSVWHTNEIEAYEQLRQYIAPIIAYLLLLAAYFLALFKFIPRRTWLPKRLRFAVILPAVLLTIFLTTSVKRDVMPQFDEEFQPKGRLYAFKWLLNHTYPFDITKRYFAVKRQVAFLQKSASERGIVVQQNEVSYRGVSPEMLGVLVIGETSRACNWQLAGYPRKTTPRLAKRSNLYFFNDVFAGANFTLLSVPQLISKATPENLYQWQTSPMLTEILAEGGFYQGWISIQSLGDVWMDIARRACNFVSLHTGNWDRDLRDEELLPRVENFLKELPSERTFLVTHTIGGHFAYTKRYTAAYAHFKPEIENESTSFWDFRLSGKKNQAFVNSFDNTIVYTDMILDSIISYVEAQHRPAFLLYVADHGENLLEPPDFHAYHSYDVPSHYEAHVPFFIWLSDEYKALYPSTDSILKAHQNLRVQSTSTLYTLLDLARVSYGTDSVQSLLSPHYHSPISRPISNPDGKLCPEPPYQGGDVCPVYSPKVTVGE